MREFLSGKYLIFFSIRQAKCVRNRQSERVRCCTLGFSSLNCMLLRNNILEIVYKTSHKLLYNVNFKSTLMHFIFVHRHDINRIYFLFWFFCFPSTPRAAICTKSIGYNELQSTFHSTTFSGFRSNKIKKCNVKKESKRKQCKTEYVHVLLVRFPQLN